MGHEARIQRVEANDEILFREMRGKVSVKIFYFVVAIVSACLTGLLGMYIGMSSHVNEINLATMQSLNAVEKNQAVMSNDLKYIADQVKKNSEKGTY
jgi:hypothetical protein